MPGHHLSKGLLLVTDPPVDEWIGHWNMILKANEQVEYVAVK
jgi:hypothetical protein